MSYKKYLLLLCALFVITPLQAEPTQSNEQTPENWNAELQLLPLNDGFSHDMHTLVPKQSILMKAYVWYPSDQSWFVRYPDWDMPGASIEKFRTPVANTEREIDGVLQYGHTQNYILTPRDIGRLKLSQTSIDTSVAQDGSAIVPLEKTIELTVKLPDGVFSLDNFLPAYSIDAEQDFYLYRNTTGVEQLSLEQVQQLTLDKGEMLERRVTLNALGIKGGSIPELIKTPSGNEVQKEHRFEDINGLFGFEGGKRIESVFYSSGKGGEVVIEPLNIEWWELNEQQLKAIELPGAKFSTVEVQAYEEAMELSWFEKNAGLLLSWISYGVIALVILLSGFALFRSVILRVFNKIQVVISQLKHSQWYLRLKLKLSVLFESKINTKQKFIQYRYHLWLEEVPPELADYIYSDYGANPNQSVFDSFRQRLQAFLSLQKQPQKNRSQRKGYALPKL